MAAGSVIYVSPMQNMIVVAHGDGWSVVELLGDEGEIDIGDTLNADWSELGGGVVRRGGESFDVYFQGTWGSHQAAVESAYRSGGGG